MIIDQLFTRPLFEQAPMASPEQLAYNKLRAQYDSYQTMTGGGGNTAVSRDPVHAAKLAKVPAEIARMAAALKAKGIDAEAQYDALSGPAAAPVDANQAYGGISEATYSKREKAQVMIYKYFGQIYDYGDDDGLNYLDEQGELWNQLMDKYNGEIEDIVAREPTDVLVRAAQELKVIADEMEFDLDEAGVTEGEVTKNATGLKHRATDKYGAGDDEPHHYTGGRSGFSEPGKYARDLEHVNKQLVKDLDASMGISWKNRGPKGLEVDEQGVTEGEYDSRKPFGVRYKVFAGREGRMTTREYWTSSEEKLQRAVDKIQALDNFYEIDGYSYPKESQGVAEGKHFKTAYGWAGGSKPGGGTYKHPDQIKADREAKKKAKEQEQQKNKQPDVGVAEAEKKQVKDRKTGQWYDPDEKFKELQKNPDYIAQMKRMGREEGKGWPKRKEQGVAEGSEQKPAITYKDYTLQYDYQTEDDDPEGYSTATTYYFDVLKDGDRVGEAEYFDYFGNLTIRINGKTKEFGFRHPLASQISQLVSSLPDEQKKDLSDPRFESQGLTEVFADQGSGSTDRDNADYMKRRNAAKKKGYTGRETKAGTWRVFKDGNAVAAAGPFKSADEAAAWIKKHKQGVTEMDKSEPSAGRDTGPRPGPDKEAKPISKEKMTKDAADVLDKAMSKEHKKKDVKEGDTLMLKLKRAMVREGRVKELADDLKTMSDADFMKKYGKAKAAIRADMKRIDEKLSTSDTLSRPAAGASLSGRAIDDPDIMGSLKSASTPKFDRFSKTDSEPKIDFRAGLVGGEPEVEAEPRLMVDPLPDMQKWGGKFATGNAGGDNRFTAPAGWRYVEKDEDPARYGSAPAAAAAGGGLPDLKYDPQSRTLKSANAPALDMSPKSKFKFDRAAQSQVSADGSGANLNIDNATRDRARAYAARQNAPVDAAKKKADWKTIYALNKATIGTNPNLIRPGMKLKMPDGSTYPVQPGDNLSKIAAKQSQVNEQSALPPDQTARLAPYLQKGADGSQYYNLPTTNPGETGAAMGQTNISPAALAQIKSPQGQQGIIKQLLAMTEPKNAVPQATTTATDVSGQYSGGLEELSTNKLARYKTAAAADAKAADQAGDFKRGDKRFGGIVQATKKQFDNDAKKVDESRAARRALMAQIVNS